jgi:hypothetical protein
MYNRKGQKIKLGSNAFIEKVTQSVNAIRQDMRSKECFTNAYITDVKYKHVILAEMRLLGLIGESESGAMIPLEKNESGEYVNMSIICKGVQGKIKMYSEKSKQVYKAKRNVKIATKNDEAIDSISKDAAIRVFDTKDLMFELKRRGFTGTLTFTDTLEL